MDPRTEPSISESMKSRGKREVNQDRSFEEGANKKTLKIKQPGIGPETAWDWKEDPFRILEPFVQPGRCYGFFLVVKGVFEHLC